VGGTGTGHNHHFVFSHKAKNKMLTLQRFNESHWQPMTAFLLEILDSVCSSESGAGIAASGHRGSALKGSKVHTCMAILDNFFLQFREFLLPPLYYLAYTLRFSLHLLCKLCKLCVLPILSLLIY